MITQSRLKELVHYDKKSGLFTRVVSTRGSRAGDLAGSVKGGYVYICVDSQYYLAHRLAVFYVTGQWPEHQVDHKNGSGTDNRWSNLRGATPAQNQQNRRPSSNNASGFPGVHQVKRSGLWVARIGVGLNRLHLGTFETPEAAYAAYITAKAQHHEFQPTVREA